MEMAAEFISQGDFLQRKKKVTKAFVFTALNANNASKILGWKSKSIFLVFRKSQFARHYVSRQTLHTVLHYCEILEMYAHIASRSTLKTNRAMVNANVPMVQGNSA